MPETQQRLLNKGEILQEGDQYWDSQSNDWRLSCGVDVDSDTDTPYRRKIEPITGYRLLEVGEKIQEGDQCYHQTGLIPYHWFPAGSVGITVTDHHLPIRRKIA